MNLGLAGLVGVAAVVGCSSVPDVRYTDGGAVDAVADSSDATPKSEYACPDRPPPPSAGVCCGGRLCAGCTEKDCGACEDQGCTGALADACCRKNQVQMDCRPFSRCR